MSDCRRTLERLTPYADDALPTGEQAEVRQHLDGCPPCRDAADCEQGARTVLHECASRLRAVPVPPGLRTRCEALAREHAGRATRRPPLWRARLVPLAIVVVLVASTALALFSLATRRSDEVLAAQLALDHMKCFRFFDAPTSVTGADAQRVEAMLAAEYGWDVHVPPSSPGNGVMLVGARRCVYADGSIPHVMYHVNGEDVSLYMLEGVQRRDADVVTLGHRSHIWSRGANTYVLVSSTAANLARAERYVMQEAH